MLGNEEFTEGVRIYIRIFLVFLFPIPSFSV